ncbi:MAG TPA: aldehyde ferredoxin oxidoreductase N-terminal domain-containing protein [Anaerolineae bacterium]|nr:aldehyde ferredoxin oxidoreductase N-terminal domain-containing protein [Anaerolineae bacterium]HOQ99549.1 aldehyde ferredoxin oxidoreductase N-terminal domain-containing protein [Anaerolineae bacterium]HPL27849.1 aldehyde ferredoxin oxidoreductase N-terminal domain-containing protein [Anaerolineae bacterium]
MLNETYVRVLDVNLSTGRVRALRREDLFAYLGGAGLATALLREYARPDLDALAPEQPIVLAIGPLSTIYPAVTKAVAMFRSPLNGELGESHAGGRLALAMRYAGYDALVIHGRAARPTYLYVDSEQVLLKRADAVWGLDAEEAGRVLRDLEPGRGHRSIMRIGPAGERLVRYALVNCETYRHFGRLGLGAVFGSKLLKGIYISGDCDFRIPDVRGYNRVYTEIYERIVKTDAMQKYHDLGTPSNVMPLHELGALPTRNLQAVRFEGAPEICGEAFAEHDLMRKVACAGCPIGCIHIALLRRQFGTEHEYSWTGISYDHELVYSLGSLLGIASREGILRLIDKVAQKGLDAIATGVTLAWATEAAERGLIDPGEMGVRPAFGDAAGYEAAIEAIVAGQSELAQQLALGATVAAQRYGGEDFALALGGNPVAGYHTGYANVLGQLVGARHSHVDNGGYSLDQKPRELSDEEIVDGLIAEEQERNALNSLAICMFARKVYDRTTVLAALGAIGIHWSEDEWVALGQRIYREKAALKESFGFRYRELTAPARFFEAPTPRGRLDPACLERMLALFNERLDAIKAS